MACKETYKDWSTRTQKAQALLVDKTLPKWEKAHLVSGAYAGLELDKLQSKHRHYIYHRLSEMNQILHRYTLKTWDDYQCISAADVQALIDIARHLACPKLK